MREALARSDLDFVLREPDSAGRRDGARLPKILRMSCVATATVVCGVIVVNALFLQDRKHPAPLLRVPQVASPETAVAPVPAPRPIAVAPVTPATSPAAAPPKPARDAIADEITRLSATPERRVKAATAAPAPALKTDGDRADPIAGLIGGATPAASPEPSAAVLSAQKALLRLGYVVRADGMMGATTKQAIEHFERDNHLPARGDLTPKLARELATRSGIAAQ